MLKAIHLIILSFLFFGVSRNLLQNQPSKIDNSNLRISQIAGKRLFELKKCVDCHTLAQTTEGDKTTVKEKRDDDWFNSHVKEESPIVLQEAKSARRQRRVLGKEVEALDDFLFKSQAAEKQQIQTMPLGILDGAYLAYQNNCLNCHAIAGAGKEVAPDLTHIAQKRGDKEWLLKNLSNPQQFAPESLMPKFDSLPKEDLEKIADYLLTLK